MQSPIRHDPRAVTQGSEFAVENELSMLRDVFRMLPTGVTVQDEQGRFVLVNDAAAALFGMAPGAPGTSPSRELDHRRRTGVELLRAGQPHIAEECINSGALRQVLLTAHRPVRIADRNLLL